MTPERLHELDTKLLKMAYVLGEMSLATRSKVGSLIYKDERIVSVGWNGMPSGFPNEEIESTKETAEGVVVTTNPLVLHAEANAILKCAKHGSSSDNATLYVSMSPCPECAKLIIQGGIKRVVFGHHYRNVDSLPILDRAGIKVEHLPLENLP